MLFFLEIFNDISLLFYITLNVMNSTHRSLFDGKPLAKNLSAYF